MGKQQGRSTSASYAIFPCFCMILGLIVLVFQAGPLSLLWIRHLQGLAASPFASNFSFPSYGSTAYGLASGNKDDGGKNDAGIARPPLPLPSIVEIKASPCICSLRMLDVFNPDMVLSQQGLINCTCPTSTPVDGSNSTTESRMGNRTECAQSPAAAPPPKTETMVQPCPPVAAPQKPIIKVEEPWYVKGRSWHMPPRFPRCTMDACFNYTRCENSDELLIYAYEEPERPVKFFARMNESRYYTKDPNRACLFFVFVDTPGLFRAPTHPSELPYWQGGLNHVIITFGDKWLNKGPNPESIGYASAMSTVMHETTYRPGFDVGIPLPPKHDFAQLRDVKPFDRKYLMTFRGLRYLYSDGTLRGDTNFRRMHNGKDVVVVTSCRHVNHKQMRQENKTLDDECNRDEAVFDSYSFGDLMNATFGLAPAGRQPSSYRFAEILSAGAVPVLIADNYVKPFDTLIQWHRCILQYPSTEMHRILKNVRAMKRPEVEKRQKYCLEIYNRWFSSDEALFQASIAAQKTRFLGAFSSWPPALD